MGKVFSTPILSSQPQGRHPLLFPDDPPSALPPQPFCSPWVCPSVFPRAVYPNNVSSLPLQWPVSQRLSVDSATLAWVFLSLSGHSSFPYRTLFIFCSFKFGLLGALSSDLFLSSIHSLGESHLPQAYGFSSNALPQETHIPLPRNCFSQNLALPRIPPHPCALTQSLTNLPFYLLTSSLNHPLPSTSTTSPKVLTTATYLLPSFQSFPCSPVTFRSTHLTSHSCLNPLRTLPNFIS